ncbi:MAG: hypothetical protein QOH23_1963 [Gaiellaceae bacterium]|nr:hypothetical protein [Gaiellaceae bacterium]
MSKSRGRVLVLDENLSVPFDRRVWQECRSLKGMGLDVSVVCPRGVEEDKTSFEELDGVRIYRFPFKPAQGGPASYVREYTSAVTSIARLARRLNREERFDVVHACNPPDLLLPAVASLKWGGTALIFDHHDLVPELYLSRFGRGKDIVYYGTLATERLTFRLADVVISTNESYRDVAIGRGKKNPEDVFVVRSAPDLSRFSERSPELTLKRGRDYLIGYVGVMGPQDGVDHALRALALLKVERQDWHAIFIGSGDVQPAMKQLSVELGLADSVEFPGRVSDDEVLKLLSTADVCLAPDPKNPLNNLSTMNKVAEYMAMARPIVAYDLVEARVSAGDAALYAVDERDFARCISTLLSDAGQRAEMGRIGRARVEQALSWEHSERSLYEAYARALRYAGVGGARSNGGLRGRFSARGDKASVRA